MLNIKFKRNDISNPIFKMSQPGFVWVKSHKKTLNTLKRNYTFRESKNLVLKFIGFYVMPVSSNFLIVCIRKLIMKELASYLVKNFSFI